MRILRMVSLSVMLGLIAAVAGQAAAQEEPVSAAADWNNITWQIRSLPTINALEFTADQLERIIPVLKQINREVEQVGKNLPVDEPTAKKLTQLREGLLQGTLGQADVDNAKGSLNSLAQQNAKAFEGLPAVQQLKALLTDDQKRLLEGATILSTGLRHRPPIPPPPFAQPGVDIGSYRAGKVLENVREMADAEYKQKRTEWATRLVERTVRRDDPNFANKVAALAAIFDGARKLTEDQFKAQREDLIKQLVSYTASEDNGPPPPPPPPPPFAGTTGHPNLKVLVDPQVIDLLEVKLTYLKAAAG